MPLDLGNTVGTGNFRSSLECTLRRVFVQNSTQTSLCAVGVGWTMGIALAVDGRRRSFVVASVIAVGKVPGEVNEKLVTVMVAPSGKGVSVKI